MGRRWGVLARAYDLTIQRYRKPQKIEASKQKTTEMLVIRGHMISKYSHFHTMRYKTKRIITQQYIRNDCF